jgi:hypothetical protein
MGVMSDPNLTLTEEEIKNREHNLITVYRLPKKNRDKMVSFFKNATLCLKDVEF